jgi:hypothetical protein
MVHLNMSIEQKMEKKMVSIKNGIITVDYAFQLLIKKEKCMENIKIGGIILLVY